MWALFRKSCRQVLMLSKISAHQRLVLFAMLCGFFICMEYAIIRPVSNSIFVSYLSSSWLPYAWLLGVPFNLLIVGLYNRYLPRIGSRNMMIAFVATVVLVNTLSAACFSYLPRFLPFFFYMWKEVYIMLMFQQLWSVIHSAIDKKKAHYLYGLIFAVGGAGGFIGSIFPGFFAVEVGSEQLIFLSLPLCCIMLLFFFLFLRSANQVRADQTLVSTDKEHKKVSITEAFGLIRNSKVLLFIITVVACMQLSASLIDFQFNVYLEQNIPSQDLRTEYFGKVLGVMNFFSIFLQLAGSYLVVRFLGLERSHFAIPLVLCVNTLGFLFFPLFSVISYCFISIKSIDHSLFGVVREMLYLQLRPEEKFQAKAIIDVFAYRASKAFGSLLLLALQGMAVVAILPIVTCLTLAIFALWLFMVRFLLRGQVKSPVH